MIVKGFLELETDESLPISNAEGPTSQLGVSTSTVGTISELRVITDLLSRGFHVFSSVSPSCPCDLVAFKEGIPCFRIEVKTGIRLRFGVRFPVPRNDAFDVLAVVSGEQIYYTPDSVIAGSPPCLDSTGPEAL